MPFVHCPFVICTQCTPCTFPQVSNASLLPLRDCESCPLCKRSEDDGLNLFRVRRTCAKQPCLDPESETRVPRAQTVNTPFRSTAPFHPIQLHTTIHNSSVAPTCCTRQRRRAALTGSTAAQNVSDIRLLPSASHRFPRQRTSDRIQHRGSSLQHLRFSPWRQLTAPQTR